jgi:asparagine synthase (glutamine-hydrolysing)
MRHVGRPLTLVFNGEIYNYVELRAELIALGHRFRTGTDTEVILAAYIAWGEACVGHFNGMWAFALHDADQGKLFCSRDRFGVKPFLWIETPKCFALGSEMRQLLPLLPGRSAHGAAVHDYLASGLTDHLEESWVRGVRQLPPGHNLVYDVAGSRVRMYRYYSPAPALDAPDSAGEAVERLQTLLQDAVRLRLRSDVRVGTCLSGGLDSSSIATLASAMRPQGSKRFCAVTAISETPENSEESYARSVVNRASLEWLTVRPTHQDFEKALMDVIDTQETPFGGPSVAMQHFVMHTAHEHGVKVLLDGQGADECWFGYERHAAVWLRDSLSQGPGVFASNIRGALANNENLSLSLILSLVAGTYLPTAAGWMTVTRYPGAQFRAALPDVWARYLRQLSSAQLTESTDLVESSLPMLLRYADRSSMRFGVEARLPFLDFRLVELSMATPVAFKFNQGWSKWPLRKAMDAKLPADVAWRKRKLGFEAPDRIWIEQVRPFMKQTIASSRLIADLFDMVRVLRSFDALSRTQAWRLFNVAAWEARQGILDLA